jgi:hypothetical protein
MVSNSELTGGAGHFYFRTVHQEKVHGSSPRSGLAELPSTHSAALVLLYAGSVGSSATAYGLTKLLLCWHNNRLRLPSRRLLQLREYYFNVIV